DFDVHVHSVLTVFILTSLPPHRSPLLPYTTLFRSSRLRPRAAEAQPASGREAPERDADRSRRPRSGFRPDRLPARADAAPRDRHRAAAGRALRGNALAVRARAPGRAIRPPTVVGPTHRRWGGDLRGLD